MTQFFKLQMCWQKYQYDEIPYNDTIYNNDDKTYDSDDKTG